ncbi:MAG: glycoside hydrolase family 15 [Bacteroidales bacterium]|nr:glycoside hydrolase family 15 [Bacteroidales bacterium]
MAREKLFDAWARRNPQFDKKYEEMLRHYCEYGKGTNEFSSDRAKILGAGYELYIVAFFIGLYADGTKSLPEDPTKRKVFGQPIEYWGNVERRGLRQAYPQLRQYIFMGLLARSDIDFLALDKDEIRLSKAVDILIDKMEEYANFGFDVIQEKLEEDSSWLSRNQSLLDLFLSFVPKEVQASDDDDEPESLD